SFEVVKADLVLQLLIVALNAPPYLCEPNELIEWCVVGHSGQPQPRRLFLRLGPLDDEPFNVSWRRSEFIAVSGPHAQKCESRLHAAAGPLSPRDRLPRGR